MNKKRFSLILLLVLLSSSLLVSMPIATAKYKRRAAKSKITFLGAESYDGGTKYTYEVESGAGINRIKWWALISRAFRKYDVDDSNEPISHRWRILRFTMSYGNKETRTVWFVLEHDPYLSPQTGMIPYLVREKYVKWGFVEGPRAPSI